MKDPEPTPIEQLAARPQAIAKLISPIVKHAQEGHRSAPATVLLDQYGAPIPNADQRQTDVHGREVQAASGEDIPYVPTVLDSAQEWELAQMRHDKLNRTPFTQREVDKVRNRVWLNFARSCILDGSQFIGMRFLWFPTPGDIGTYELRRGNAPANGDRPNHLRNLRLEIDCTDISSHMRAVLQSGGDLEQLVTERLEAAGEQGNASITAVALQGAIRSMADQLWQRGISPA